MPTLHGDDGVDGTTVTSLPGPPEAAEGGEEMALERREELRVEFFTLQAVPFGRRSLAQVNRLHTVAEALDDVWPLLLPSLGRMRRKKRRKKRLPEVSSSRALRTWKPGHYSLRALRVWQSVPVSECCFRFDSGYMFIASVLEAFSLFSGFSRCKWARIRLSGLFPTSFWYVQPFAWFRVA